MFSYDTEEKNPEGNTGRIAPFARRNHYKELVLRMKEIVRSGPPPLNTLTKRQYRLFCNSRLPEKELALRAGLGFLGKNSLLIHPDRGSRCLIAGMALPGVIALAPPAEKPDRRELSCGSCRLCAKACPTGAIADTGFVRDKCLQSWTTDPRPVPDHLKERWGNRIYGCTDCQDVCPWNRNLPGGSGIERSPLPSEVPLVFLLEASDEEIIAFFKGSTMGMSWIRPEMLRRNAALCAATAGRTDLRPLLERILREKTEPALCDACRWALEKLKRSRAWKT